MAGGVVNIILRSFGFKRQRLSGADNARKLKAEVGDLSQAARKFGLTPDGVRYHIKKLKQGNLLHHEGPTKKGRWVFGPGPKGKSRAK